jgi:beta-N-acetylhexosaminidase
MSRFGATILSSDGPRLTQDEKAFFRDVNPFGFILFGRHIQTADQIRALCAEFRDAVGRDCLITIDQEGGRVQRLHPPLARRWRPALGHATEASQPIRAMYLRARLIADELRQLGIDSNCIPNLDLATPETHDFLANRCYGDDPDQVAAVGRAVADGLLDGGVVPVMKHVPGHGRATMDSHLDLPVVDARLEVLRETDFKPFALLGDLPLSMTAHLVYSALDPLPATLSPAVMRMVRDDIGVDGLIMTDDISMKALTGTLADLSRTALAAGCDVVLHCNDTLAERRVVAEAAGEMVDAAQKRAEAAMTWRRKPDVIDIPALEAELETLLGGQVYG